MSKLIQGSKTQPSRVSLIQLLIKLPQIKVLPWGELHTYCTLPLWSRFYHFRFLARGVLAAFFKVTLNEIREALVLFTFSLKSNHTFRVQDFICFLTYWHVSQSSTSHTGVPTPSALHMVVTHRCMSTPSLLISPFLCLPLARLPLVHIRRHSPTRLLFLSAYHPSDPVTWTFFSPFSVISSTSSSCMLASLQLVSTSFSHILLFIPAFSLCIPPYSSASHPPPTTCLCSTPVRQHLLFVGHSEESALGAAVDSQNEWWWLCLLC